MLKALWADETGAILCIELILVGTVVGIGIITGFTAMRDATITEMAEMGAAASMDQSYLVRGQVSHSSATADSTFTNSPGNLSSPLAARCVIVPMGEPSTTGTENSAS
jgi:hypothetical protein